MRGAALVAALALAAAGASPLRAFVVVDGGIPQSLTGRAGDPARGREVVASRDLGNCLLCHAAPIEGERFQGDLAPDLAGVGRRLTPAQLRLRLVDPTRINPETIMPAYYRVDSLERVAAAYRGRPVLTAEQIEDAVAYLATLRD